MEHVEWNIDPPSLLFVEGSSVTPLIRELLTCCGFNTAPDRLLSLSRALEEDGYS